MGRVASLIVSATGRHFVSLPRWVRRSPARLRSADPVQSERRRAVLAVAQLKRWERPSDGIAMARIVAEREAGLPRGGTEGIAYDEGQWPLVEIRWPPDPSTAELDAHLRRLQGYLDRGVPFKLLYDVSRTRPINSLERKEFVDFFSRNREALQLRCRGVAYITRKAVHRGILTAIGWFITFPFPLEVSATREQGLQWLRQIRTDP
ncbi:MAG: hypothetical protein GY937_03760 [bacterium]|nr:hypothetical protein [bacterium]